MMQLIKLLAFAITLCTTSVASAQQARVVIDDFQISTYVTAVKSSLHLPSVAAGIVGSKQNYYLEAFGPAELDERFRLGSLSKSYTALAAHILAEEGALDLNAPISTWYPDAPADVTIQHLLDHRSGLSGADGYVAFNDPDGSLDNWVRGGSWAGVGEYEYSNLNYALLGGILEKTAETPFDEVLKTRIFEPTGMKTAIVASGAGDAVPGHQYLFGFPVQRSTPDIAAKELPAGGVMASPRDAARFLRALLGGGELDGEQVLPAAAVEQMLSGDAQERYASGWGRISIGGVDVAMHSGLTATFASFHAVAPERDVGVFVVTNVNTYQAGGAVAIGKGLLRTMLGATPEPVSNVEFVVRLGLGVLLLLSLLAFLIELFRWFGARMPSKMNRKWVIRFALFAVPGVGVVVGLSAVTGMPIDAMVRFQPDVAAVVVGVPTSLVLRQLFKGFNATSRERHVAD